MTLWRALYWCVFTATGVVYAIMLLGTLPAISEGAGGLMPFDMRPFGYSTSDAQTFLTNLTDDARAFYLGPQRLLDSVFPALYGLSLVGAFRVLLANRTLRRVLILVSVCAVLADYVENIRIARMLLHDGLVPEPIVSAASQATIIKSALNAVAMVSLFVALGFAAVSKWKSR